MADRIELTIDGKPVTAQAGATLWEAAHAAGVDIPVLCHHPRLAPVGVCRVCAVEVEGGKGLAASCVRRAEPDMVVRTATPRVRSARRMLVELLLADYPKASAREARGETDLLLTLARAEGIQASRFAGRAVTDGRDDSSKVIAVDHNACILCDRCIRACDDVQVNDVIGRRGKGHAARIAFDDDRPMGASTCVSCGECASVCPTGALVDRLLVPVRPEDLRATRPVDSVCPYCGVGCAITYHVAGNTIVQVAGRDESPGNQGRLCVKGRYGYDYAHHAERLTVPLIRRPEFPKRSDSYADPMRCFREATWDEALDLAAATWRRIRAESGPSAFAGFGSAKCSNEDNYLFQKFIRAVFGTNNVDHCTRLCHASSVAALMEQVGSGAVSDVFGDVRHADCAFLIGTNTTANHPVAATFFKQAARAGCRLIVADTRRVDMARHAEIFLQFEPGTDVALLNGMMHAIFAEGLQNDAFIQERTVGIEALRATVAKYPPEAVAKICGIPADLIVRAARAYATARAAIIFWGMGISQHSHGTDNSRSLINLCLICGQVGRQGTGLHPLRGQNNVQGASDVGLIPMVYTGYQSVADPAVRRTFEAAWGVPLDPQPGLTVVEIMGQVLERNIRTMYMMGENPFLSDPNINKVKKALAAMEFLVVQDIFLTETAEYADVVLPAASFAEKDGCYTNTDRRVQRARKAVNPPGQARPDWEIVADLSGRMGYPMQYGGVEAIWDEIRSLTPPFAGLRYDRLNPVGRLWPCPDETHEGTTVLFDTDFPTGKGKLVPAEFRGAAELPDDEYPFVLNTGRLLEHWHTGTMTRRAVALEAIAPEVFVDMHADDMARLDLGDGDRVTVASRRGTVTLRCRASRKQAPGAVFIPFHFKEAAANLLTNDVLDPYGKIPEFKFCAVKVTPAP